MQILGYLSLKKRVNICLKYEPVSDRREQLFFICYQHTEARYNDKISFKFNDS